MTYEELLNNAPQDHCSDEFLEYLRNYNKVVQESDIWLVIENFKYHSAERPWYTAFLKQSGHPVEHEIGEWFPDMEIIIKPKSKRSVNRFHVHLTNLD
jgi:hypothetical protein